MSDIGDTLIPQGGHGVGSASQGIVGSLHLAQGQGFENVSNIDYLIDSKF